MPSILAKLDKFDTLEKSFYSFLFQQISLSVVLLITACLEKVVNKTEPVTQVNTSGRCRENR